MAAVAGGSQPIPEVHPMARKEWEYDARLTSNPETADQFTRENPDPDQRLVIGVLADLAGQAGATSPWLAVPLHKRRFIDIDRDNFGEVLSRCDVRWRGSLEGPAGDADVQIPVDLAFRDIEDFHPDRIVQQIPALRALHGLLADLEDPARYDEAAAKLATWSGFVEEPRAEKTPAPSSKERPPDPVDKTRLLDAILERQEPPRTPASELDRLVREIVAPHAIRTDARRQGALVAAVHGALSSRVSILLHHPAFQSLEALWRSVRFLVDSAGADTRVRVVHVTKEELLSEVISGKSLEASELARLLLEPASIPGSEQFSLLVGAYEFSHDLEDLAILERLGNVCAGLKAPMISAAAPQLFGSPAFEGLPPVHDLEKLFDGKDFRPWQLLRQTPPARWLALALPRLLCRLPYGARTQPADSFLFEEQVQADHGKLVWGNPAFAVAAVFAQAFAADGWQLDPSASMTRLEGLPLYNYEADGEIVTKPCAEVLMGEQTVEALMNGGLLPLVSYRDADIVGFPSLQTLANPRAPLRVIR
jgi:type VI secretion system protein ImpC